jgi:2'-5' RNA ligase
MTTVMTEPDLDDVVAPRSGGVIAAIPRWDCAAQLAVPGGDHPDTLHLPLIDLGGVAGLPSAVLQLMVGRLADRSTQIEALVIGRGEYADGGAIYLLADHLGQQSLTELHDDALREASRFNIPPQRCPWAAHITVGRVRVDTLMFAGLVTFNRLALFDNDGRHDYPMVDPEA